MWLCTFEMKKKKRCLAAWGDILLSVLHLVGEVFDAVINEKAFLIFE
jgi:hypothetical protein